MRPQTPPRTIAALLAAMLILPSCGSTPAQEGLDIIAGPEHMSTGIAPVNAPFRTISFTRPAFHERSITVSIPEEASSSDPAAATTSAIQQAIDEMAAHGGGTVIIPDGHWTTGRICLKSNVNLHLSEGCVLNFSGRIKDYLPAVYTRDEGVNLYSLGACIYADGQTNIAVTGTGTIKGPSTDCEIYKRNSETVHKIEDLTTGPEAERIFEGRDGGPVFLPKTISPIRCRKVFIEGVTLEDGLFWNIVPQYCEDVIIRGVTVRSFGHGRTDGIDIDSSRDVLIEYCSLDCQDDCYTMKSGRGDDGVDTAIPTENVVIRNSVALRGAGGIVCGTETAGGIRNIYLHDCIFDGTDQAFRFKSRRPRGGGAENIYIERVKADILRDALFCDLLGSSRWVGQLAQRYPALEVTRLTPYLRNISIHDIEIENCRNLINIAALPELKASSIFFGNVSARCENIGKVQDVNGFSIKDIRVESEDTHFTVDACDYASFFGFANTSKDCPIQIDTIGKCNYLCIQNYPLHPVRYSSVKPGEVWLDTDGKPIQAHGFQVTYRDGRYYWYGEDKTATLFGTNRVFCGVRCYSSDDFYNWKDEGDILAPSADPASPLHWSQKLERPHIVYSEKTGKYVCWLKYQANDGHFVITQSDSFLGPYEYVTSIKPDGFAVGDFDMYTDPQTGKSYVWFERPHWEYICAELTEDCLGVNGRFSEHFVGLTPPLTREAAAHFVKDGRHYIFTSGTTGYTPNPSEIAVFDAYHGEYEVLGDPHVGDRYAHSFCSQITSVLKIPGRDLYVAMADRWQPHTFNTDIPSREHSGFLARYKDHRPYPRDFNTPTTADRRYTLVTPSQAVYNATYVFLPVVFRDGMPTIEWKDEWRLEDYD